MKSFLALVLFSLLAVVAFGAEPSGRHFIYAQYDFILTFELTGQKEAILNVVNFTERTYFVRPQHISLIDSKNNPVPVQKIVMETGNPSDPFKTSNMKILPNSFIGLTLQGDFSNVEQLKFASVQFGNTIYSLDSLSELQFNIAADKINKVNFDSPDVREDFRVVKLDFLGRKQVSGEPVR
ncbi:MAG TPA: hypothetical protein VGK99_02315 [Acidobacteriota bacterium]|jgi:hypothetical protein